jgi:hypothetical protein
MALGETSLATLVRSNSLPQHSLLAFPHISLRKNNHTQILLPPLFPTSDYRPVALEVTVPLAEIPAREHGEEGDDPRIYPPFELDIDWKSKRDRARILELVAGFTMYFTTRMEGGGVLLALAIGAIGAYFAIRALLEF